MDFGQFCTLFVSKIDELLSKRSKHGKIFQSDIESLSKLFTKFAKYDLEHEELIPFVNSVFSYFLLIIRYALQFKETTFHESQESHQVTVKIALAQFLIVVDKTQIYRRLIKHLVKVIDKLVETYGKDGVIQDILKVYLGCLSNVDKNVLERLARKHKSIHLLAATARDAHETYVQAVIIEIVLKLSHTEEPLLEHMFPEVEKSVVADPINDYPKIRMILEELNTNSSKIFSVNCTSIMLDHYLVSEYEGANSINGVWLDIDLTSQRLSFFCTPGFLSGFTDTQFCQASSWEVLSFYMRDCLDTTFNYNEDIDNLEIDIKIRISSFNLFRHLKFDTVRHLVIKISKDSKKYKDFVKVIMPQVFSNFSAEDFAYTCEEGNIDDDATTNASLVSSDHPKTPDVEHSTLKKMSNPVESEILVLDESLLDSGSVINLTEDDEDEIQEQVQAAEVSKHDTVKKTKLSKNKDEHMEKSFTSSISFTESLLAGKPKSKVSKMDMKTKMSARKKSNLSAPKRKPNPSKISAMRVSSTDHLPELDSSSSKAKSNKHMEQNAEKAPSNENQSHGQMDTKRKMSTRKKSKLSAPKKNKPKPLKISAMPVSLTDDGPELDSSSSKAQCKHIEHNVEAAPSNESPSHLPLDDDVDVVVRDVAKESLEHSVSKVKNWMMSNRKQLSVLLEEEENNSEFKIPEQLPVKYVPTPESNISSNQPLEQRITRYLSEGHYEPSEKTRELITQKLSGRTESLLETLAKDDDINADIQPSVDMDEVPQTITESKETEGKKIHLPIETDMISDNSEENKENRPNSSVNSENSNLPLAQLVSQWKTKNQKPLNTSQCSNIIPDVKIIEYGDISSDDDGSVIVEILPSAMLPNQSQRIEASNLDILTEKTAETKEVEKSEKSSSKQLFEFIINKEVKKTKPIVDKDIENHSLSPENYVDTQRNERYQSRAEYLFDKLKANETTIPMNSDKSSKNLSTKVADSSLAESKAESKTGKRRLYNPNDLSYLENMITDDNINSKHEEKIPIIEIKDPRKSKTKKTPPAAKRGRRKKVQEVDVDFSNLKTTKCERKAAIGVETPFDKVIREGKLRKQEHKEEKKKQKLIEKSKRRGKKAVVLSPSTESSSESFGIPLDVLLKNRKRRVTTGETPEKRMKNNDGTSKNVRILSDIIIRKANSLQPDTLNGEVNNNLENSSHRCCCEMSIKYMRRTIFDFIAQAKACKAYKEELRKVINEINSDIFH